MIYLILNALNSYNVNSSRVIQLVMNLNNNINLYGKETEPFYNSTDFDFLVDMFYLMI